MSTDTFDITKLSRAMTGKKRCYSTIIRTPWIYGLLSAGIKDNGVFVESLIENALKKNAKTWSIFLALSGMKNYEDRNYSKAGC